MSKEDRFAAVAESVVSNLFAGETPPPPPPAPDPDPKIRTTIEIPTSVYLDLKTLMSVKNKDNVNSVIAVALTEYAEAHRADIDKFRASYGMPSMPKPRAKRKKQE